MFSTYVVWLIKNKRGASQWQEIILIQSILFIYSVTEVIPLGTVQASYKIRCKVKVGVMLITYYFCGQDRSFPSSHVELQFLQTASERTCIGFCHSRDVFLWINVFVWSLVPVSTNSHKKVLTDSDRQLWRSVFINFLSVCRTVVERRGTRARVCACTAWVRVCGALALVYTCSFSWR